MKDSVDRKYVTVLGAVALLILIGGAFLRPKKFAPQPPPPSESATLQSRIQRDDLAETASYLGQRAQVFAQHVLYDPDHGSSALVWEKSGQVLTTPGPKTGVFDPPLLLRPRASETGPPKRATEQNAGWLIVVARSANDRLLWTPAIYGGNRQSTCSGGDYDELVVNVPLDAALSGAGAFDLDGTLHGIVAPCDGTFHLISVASIPRLLLTFSNPKKQIRATYGFSASELDSAAKRLFATESGLFVTEVSQGGAAQEAGLKAGDLILSIGQRPIASVGELADVLAATEEPGRDLNVLRNSKRLSVSFPPSDEATRARSADSTLGIRILSAPTGETIVVEAGTPAYRSGLRTGDRLIQVGETRSRGLTTLRRALTRSGEQPVFVVYFRGASERAAVVER
jgi:PDZ domain